MPEPDWFSARWARRLARLAAKSSEAPEQPTQSAPLAKSFAGPSQEPQEAPGDEPSASDSSSSEMDIIVAAAPSPVLPERRRLKRPRQDECATSNASAAQRALGCSSESATVEPNANRNVRYKPGMTTGVFRCNKVDVNSCSVKRLHKYLDMLQVKKRYFEQNIGKVKNARRWFEKYSEMLDEARGALARRQ